MGDYSWDFDVADAALESEKALVDALMIENRVLARELARVQQRCTAWHAERAAESLRFKSELERLRAALARAVTPPDP